MEIPEMENGVKKGPWTPEEDQKLIDCVQKFGHGNWKQLPKLAGLNRCGKSCRLRWTNYLRPDIKRGAFSHEEQQLIIDLHAKLGNKWSAIASYLPGRTDNEIKNFWNTRLKKRLLQNGIDPVTHTPMTPRLDSLLPVLLPNFLANSSRNPNAGAWENVMRFQRDAAKLAKILLISNILQLLNSDVSNNGRPPLPVDAAIDLHSLSTDQLIGLQPRDNALTFQPDFISNVSDQPVFLDSTHENAMETDMLVGDIEGKTTSNHRMPGLVSASPERLRRDDETRNIDVFATDFSNPSSTSTTFEALGDLMDDEENNYYWKQILDQASLSP